MLLAEALIERADAQRRLADLRQRIAANALVQEGEEPAEDPNALLDEAARLIDRVQELLVAVNATNSATRLPDGTTVTEALAQRDALSLRARLLVDAAKAAANRTGRYGLKEIRDVAVLDVADLRGRADALVAGRRELDVRLQRVNWATELGEGR